MINSCPAPFKLLVEALIGERGGEGSQVVGIVLDEFFLQESLLVISYHLRDNHWDWRPAESTHIATFGIHTLSCSTLQERLQIEANTKNNGVTHNS